MPLAPRHRKSFLLLSAFAFSDGVSISVTKCLALPQSLHQMEGSNSFLGGTGNTGDALNHKCPPLVFLDENVSKYSPPPCRLILGVICLFGFILVNWLDSHLESWVGPPSTTSALAGIPGDPQRTRMGAEGINHKPKAALPTQSNHLPGSCYNTTFQ